MLIYWKQMDHTWNDIIIKIKLDSWNDYFFKDWAFELNAL
jgi:hypothetical protein